jgi:diacylglycerol kinase family enzyme
LARQSQDCDTVVAVGGDGTISEVLDGIVQSGRDRIRMGVLYAGTSPDFCLYHGIPTDPSAALRALIEGKSRKVDVARIAFANPAGARLVSHFACSCNIGLGPAVARMSNRIRPFFGDRLGTALALFHALATCAPVDLDIEIDGQETVLPQTNNLSVLKNPHIASGLKLNVDLAPDDGKLCLAGIFGRSRIGLIRAMPGFYSGKAASGGNLLLRTCFKATVRARVAQEIEFDGDPRGYLPAEITVLPKALDLVGGVNE